MNTIGLFAGIGGIEYGLDAAGMTTTMLCEIMPEAQCVLGNRFPNVLMEQDVTKLSQLPVTDLLAAGFPCQNISIAGNKRGISGEQSSLIYEIFRLLDKGQRPHFLFVENVANIISLNKGEALALLAEKMQEYHYEWAYRLVDPRSFGIPQRRPRFIFLASDRIHPKDVLFPENEDVTAEINEKPSCENIEDVDAYGFYWTEGKIGIGWANNSIPPLKCGSSLGLPSSPAIWDVKHDFFGTPSIEDAERLQGFPEGWTNSLTENGFKGNKRWKLVGNAVNTVVSNWLGDRLEHEILEPLSETRLFKTKCHPWPKAAISFKGNILGVKASVYPCGINYTPILEFLRHPMTPLSLRATLGFQKRVLASTLIKYPETFKNSLNIYLKKQYDYE